MVTIKDLESCQFNKSHIDFRLKNYRKIELKARLCIRFTN